MTTIGVAIAVPDPWGEELRDYRCALGDTAAEKIPTHITLLPPFEVELAGMAEVERHLGDVASRNQVFPVHLRGTGTFRPTSPVVFVSVVRGISACEILAFAVRCGPLAVTPRFPYHPHVTVAQGLSEEQLDRAFGDLKSFECEFDATAFSLFVHDDGQGWQRTRDLPLAATADRLA